MKEYITEGPAAGESTADFFIGSLLYWPIWATIAALCAGWFVFGHGASVSGPDYHYPLGFIGGMLTMHALHAIDHLADPDP